MRKLFLSVVISIMFIFVVWTIIAYYNYGSDITSYHLDLYATFQKFNLYNIDNNGLNGFTIIDSLNALKKALKDITESSLSGVIIKHFTNADVKSWSIGFQVVVNVLETLLNPIFAVAQTATILGYLTIIFIQVAQYVVNFLMGCYEFIFAPVFIHV